jgi:hypothetical protein
LLQNQPKQIGFPHFNTGREHLPVRSGADKLIALRLREMNVKSSKRLVAKSAKTNRVSDLQYWKRYLPVNSGADKLIGLRVVRGMLG